MAKVGRLLKEEMVEELTKRLSAQPNLFVTRVSRLTAPDADALRQKLHASRAEFVLIKQRIGTRALQSLKLDGVNELFEGSVGLVLPEDDVLPVAKLIVDFIKSHENQLAVRGAYIDGQVLDKSRVETLASLPPKPVLLAQVVLTIESPLADLIFTVERLIGDLAYVVEQMAAKQPAQTETKEEGTSS
jgi:large subunit ribosomal protein L10